MDENFELSDAELAEFLNEIEDEDITLEEQETNALHEVSTLDESIGNLYEGTRFEKRFYTSEDSRRKQVISEARIKREAFQQSIIDLSAPIPKKHFRILITLLTEPQTRLINNYSDYINKRIGKLLLKQMPRMVRTCWKLYPHIMRPTPGFLYKAPISHGKEYFFWAYPNIPAYFPQHCERDAILEKNPKAIETLDKAIKQYHVYLRNKQKREIRFAEIFLRNNIKTYFDLLKFKPVMWEMLYNHLASTPKRK